MRPIYPERESKILEFKSKLPVFQSLIKTCVAFANGNGGKIIIGVEDQTREIIGINDAIRDRIYDEFPNSLYDATSPSLLVDIYEKNFDDLSVIIIETPSSIKKPVCVKKEGTNGVYLRAGSNTRKATKDYIEDLMRESQRIHFDEEIIHENIDILSQLLITRIYNRKDPNFLANEKIVRHSGPNGKIFPTIAGTLLFCEHPEQYIPEALIQCTRFKGIDGRDIIQSEEISGNLEKQIETSFDLVKSWLSRDYKLSKTRMKSETIIPANALREAIVNAVIHRKYWIPGGVKIALYDDRLEIFNPGNFPGLVDIYQLGDGTTYLRNPNLARIARRFGIVEKLGTGIRLMQESCKKAKIRMPEFVEGTDSVKVIFSFLPADNKFISDEEKLLKLFNLRTELKVDEVENYLKVSRNTATRKLNLLIQQGKIKRIGKGPAVRFVLE